MKCYIRKDDIIDSEEFLEVKKVTFSSSASELKKLADFLNEAADSLEHTSIVQKPINLMESNFKLTSNFDIVIMNDNLF